MMTQSVKEDLSTKIYAILDDMFGIQKTPKKSEIIKIIENIEQYNSTYDPKELEEFHKNFESLNENRKAALQKWLNVPDTQHY